jgi:predicted Kef-type K+ transport protein
MDFVILLVAFMCGFAAKLFNTPPLIGFLAAGFILNALGYTNNDALQIIADLGITILLFTIGLKLHLKDLIARPVWVSGLSHTAIWVAVVSLFIFVLGNVLMLEVFNTSFTTAALISFALSFSSTVCVIKILDEAGETKTRHGKLAIGILVIQDILAVLFLVFSTGKMPSVYAFGLFLLLPCQPLIHKLLFKSGHGELLPLTGFIFAFGAYSLFEMVGVKGDLGALVAGVMLASHAKANELSKALYGFKDLFLVGFFLTIGLSAMPTWEMLAIALFLCVFLIVKFALFFGLFIALRLRARTAFLSALLLSNFSEFGLIVGAVAVSATLLEPDWLVIIAIAASISFVCSSLLYKHSHRLYMLYKEFLKRFEHPNPLAQDIYPQLSCGKVLVVGMGRVGKGAFKALHSQMGNTVWGMDSDPQKIKSLVKLRKNVLVGDGEDIDLWENLDVRQLELVLIALPSIEDAANVTAQLKRINYTGKIAAIARYEDEVAPLINHGVDKVFNFFTEAGLGFAEESMAWAGLNEQSN